MADETTERDLTRQNLSKRLEAAKSLDEVRSLFADVLSECSVVGHEYAVNLANSLCSASASATRTMPELVVEITKANVLPFLLLEDDSEESRPAPSMEQHYLRDNIREWVYQYPHVTMRRVRNEVLNLLEQLILTDPREPYFWCVSVLGFRTESLNRLLWGITRSSEKFADTAAATLVNTGLSQTEFAEILDLVEARIKKKCDDHFVRIAIQDLVGPERCEIAVQYLNSVLEADNNNESFKLSLAFSISTRSVDRCSDNDSIHDKAWSILRRHPEIVRQSPEYSYRCNSSSVIEDHYRWLGEIDETDLQNYLHWTYIYLSRLEELVKPAHLDGWRDADSTSIKQQLQSIVARDSGHQGQWATTTSKLKPDALAILLTIGFVPAASFIEQSLVGESSGHVAGDIAKLLACTPIGELPDSLLELVRSGKRTEGDEDNQHLFRHIGLIELVQSCQSRSAFDAMSQFGFVYRGNVLIATVDAISELAIARIEQGDTDIPDVLTRLATSAESDHQREAATSVFCRLVRTGYIRGKWPQFLLDLLDDRNLKPNTKGELIEAIGQTQLGCSKLWRDELWKYAEFENEPINWRAMELFIRREWMGSDQKTWLQQQLSLHSSNGSLHLRNADQLASWQAYLLGLLYSKDVSKYADAVTSAILETKADVFYQLVRPVSRLGQSNAPGVIESLGKRILSLNTQYSTDTGLFAVLAKLSSSLLLEIVKSARWHDWMVEGRAALCEAVADALFGQPQFNAKEYIIPFMRDGSFQVRRSAYRVLSNLDHTQLFSICQLWSNSGDVELERRAAEIVEWLPLSYYPDDFISKLEFQGNSEPEVREAFGEVLNRRRRRTWAEKYLDSLLTACRQESPDSGECFRLTQALAKLGDDESIRQIKNFITHEALSTWKRTLLKRATKLIEKQWKKTTEKWPTPWSHVEGDLEEVKGKLVLADGSEISANVLLWRKHRFDQSERYSWGGIAVGLSGRLGFWNNDLEIRLVLSGREDSKILVGNIQTRSRIGTEISFHGQSEYPSLKPSIVSPTLLFDSVVSELRKVEFGLSLDEARQIAEKIQPIIEASDLAIMFQSGVNQVEPYLPTTEVMLTVRAIAEVVRERDPQALLVWRLTDRLLRNFSRQLQLSPSDLDVFSRLVFYKGRDAEEELLMWIRDHMAPIGTSNPMQRAKK